MKLVIGNDFEITLKTARDFVFQSGDVTIASNSEGIKFTGGNNNCPITVEGSAHGWDYLSDRSVCGSGKFTVVGIDAGAVNPSLADNRCVQSAIAFDETGQPSATLHGYDIEKDTIKHDGAIGIDFDDPKWGTLVEGGPA